MKVKFITFQVQREVMEEVEAITCTLPGKVFYSDDGEALILCDDGKYIIAVTPNDTEFNGGNPTTESAYLFAYPAEHECLNEPGWSTGWEC